MKTIRIKVYQFSELSAKAKEYATEQNAYDCEFFNADEYLESLKKFAEHFCCELIDYEIDWLNSTCYSSVKFNVPDYVNEWTEEELKTQVLSMGSYNAETLRGDGECVFTGVGCDEDAADGLRKAYFEGERDMNTLLQAGFKTWFKAANDEYEYQLSQEGYAEHCEGNEYEFTKDGKRFNY